MLVTVVEAASNATRTMLRVSGTLLGGSPPVRHYSANSAVGDRGGFSNKTDVAPPIPLGFDPHLLCVHPDPILKANMEHVVGADGTILLSGAKGVVARQAAALLVEMGIPHVKTDIGDLPPGFEYMDVTCPHSVGEMFARHNVQGTLSLAANLSGKRSDPQPGEHPDAGLWRTAQGMFDVNVMGTMNMARASLVQAERGGRLPFLVTASSIAATLRMPISALGMVTSQAYGWSKDLLARLSHGMPSFHAPALAGLSGEQVSIGGSTDTPSELGHGTALQALMDELELPLGIRRKVVAAFQEETDIQMQMDDDGRLKVLARVDIDTRVPMGSVQQAGIELLRTPFLEKAHGPSPNICGGHIHSARSFADGFKALLPETKVSLEQGVIDPVRQRNLTQWSADFPASDAFSPPVIPDQAFMATILADAVRGRASDLRNRLLAEGVDVSQARIDAARDRVIQTISQATFPGLD